MFERRRVRLRGRRALLYERQRFLADASAMLASPVDVDASVAQVAARAVQHVVPWIAVLSSGANGRARLVLAHEDLGSELMDNGHDELQGLLEGVERIHRIAAPSVSCRGRRIVLGVGRVVPLLARGKRLGALAIGCGNGMQGAEVVGFVDDVALRVAIALDNARLYRQAEEARAEAELASRAKDEFLDTLSHELRTPLNAILGWVQLFRQESLAATELQRGIEVIERNAKAQAQLVEDLLDMSRIASGKLSLDLQPVYLSSVVRAALDVIAPHAKRKSLVIDAQLTSTAAVLGDARRLEQVVWNLLSNAIKFSEAAGRIAVTCEGEEHEVRVVVKDHGRGIEPSYLPMVFDRFHQADSSITRQHGGLGIGLALVRSLVRAHGGTVSAESLGRGFGAIFSMTLPVLATAQGDSPRSPIPEDVQGKASLAGLRILVVEDDLDARDLLLRILRNYEGEVCAVASAREAFLALDTFLPHIMVSDIGLPDQDGYDLLRRVRDSASASRWNLPAVALTAYAGMHDRQRALEAGFQAYVAKPVDGAELVRVVLALAHQGGIGGHPPLGRESRTK